MSTRHPVTIGLPFYNSVRTIGDAIRSVFAQTFRDWEFILIDDGSTDGSERIVRAIDDARVRLYSDGKHRGLATRLNEIAHMARGEYLVRMDADDIMHPRRIETQLAAIQRNPDAAIVATGVTLIDANGVPIAYDRPQPPSNTFDLLRAPQIVHPTVLGRTEWFRRNPYSADFPRAEDCELWCRTMACSSNVISIPDSLLFYRVDFSLRKYLASLSTQARITLKHGPALTTWPATAVLWLYVVAKMGLWSAAALCGMTERVQAIKLLYFKRFQTLAPSDLIEAGEVLARIAGTEVNGWDKVTAFADLATPPT